MTSKPIDARAQELLADRAQVGLSEAERLELNTLGVADDHSFDLAAAALDVALTKEEPMPAALAERVLAAAPKPANAPTNVVPLRAPSSLPWLAAAACLVIAAGAWWYAISHPVTVIAHEVSAPASSPSIVAPPPPKVPTPNERRAALLADAKDTVVLAWSPTKDPAGTSEAGDVVWSASRQEGFMRFTKLAPNDASRTQYQLWIFDAARDAKYPIDGGVFDVPPSGEVVVPISAKLHVDSATLFAVTVEKPGGVVVSQRERIVVTAAPKKSG